MLAMLGRVTREMIDELSGIFSNVLGWNAQQREAEVTRAISILADKHGVQLQQEQRNNVRA